MPGVPDGYVSADRTFSILEGWSDGSTELSRAIRLERDFWLNARFVVRPPDLPGIIPGTVRWVGHRRIQFVMAGIPSSHFYRLEQSGDLRDWRPVRGIVVLSGNGAFPSDSFSVPSLEATVMVNVPDLTPWYRVTKVAW